MDMSFSIFILTRVLGDRLEHLPQVERLQVPALVHLHQIVMEVETAKVLELQRVQIVQLL